MCLNLLFHSFPHQGQLKSTALHKWWAYCRNWMECLNTFSLLSRRLHSPSMSIHTALRCCLASPNSWNYTLVHPENGILLALFAVCGHKALDRALELYPPVVLASELGRCRANQQGTRLTGILHMTRPVHNI